MECPFFRGRFFDSIGNLHLCVMSNQGLLALAQLILPSEILSNFEVARAEEESSLTARPYTTPCSLDRDYHINGNTFEKQYKEMLSSKKKDNH